jgi:hypothetical protein
VVAEAAYAACLRLARQHYENFPVASRLMPPASRPHIAAIYAFARIADDFADEGDAGSHGSTIGVNACTPPPRDAQPPATTSMPCRSSRHCPRR